MLRVVAHTCGRTEVSEFDTLLLQHVVWQRPEEAPRIRDWLLERVAQNLGSQQAPGQLPHTPARASDAPAHVHALQLQLASAHSLHSRCARTSPLTSPTAAQSGMACMSSARRRRWRPSVVRAPGTCAALGKLRADEICSGWSVRARLPHGGPPGGLRRALARRSSAPAGQRSPCSLPRLPPSAAARTLPPTAVSPHFPPTAAAALAPLCSRPHLAPHCSLPHFPPTAAAALAPLCSLPHLPSSAAALHDSSCSTPGPRRPAARGRTTHAPG